MITTLRLRELLSEIQRDKLLGESTVQRTLDLVGQVKRGTRLNYRIEVWFKACPHDHHKAWTTIFVEVTSEGFRLMRQRATSCPLGGSTFCDEIDPRPILLDEKEEFDLFVMWAHRIVVSPDVLAILQARHDYPFREYPLAASETRTLMDLPGAVADLITAVRQAIVDLEETKAQFKSESVARIRRALDWALFGVLNAQSH